MWNSVYGAETPGHASGGSVQNGAVQVTDWDTRVAAYAVIVDARERVLLALWNEVAPPRWTMPGGGVEFAETVEEAVVREVREETGYAVRVGRLLGVHSHVVQPEDRVSGNRPLKSLRVVFTATVIGGVLSREVDGTTDEARWFDLADVTGLNRVPLVDIALQMRRAARAEPT
jgi:8-oxo-dGTP diphosphatase